MDNATTEIETVDNDANEMSLRKTVAVSTAGSLIGVALFVGINVAAVKIQERRAKKQAVQTEE